MINDVRQRFIQEGVGVTTNHKVNSAGSGNKLRISDIAGVVLSIADMRKGYDKITVGAEFIGILLDRGNHIKLRDTVGNVTRQHILEAAKDADNPYAATRLLNDDARLYILPKFKRREVIVTHNNGNLKT